MRTISLDITAIIIFLISPFINVIGQSKIKFENLSVIDGLSNSGVQSIVQDSDGFMWFGTIDGLNKYDGKQFTVFRDDPESENKISGNLVIKIFEDSRKTLWVGTEQGLNKYNKDTEKFENYQVDSTDTRAFFNGVVGINEDDKGNLWIGKAFHGLTLFDRDSLKYKFVKADTMDENTSLFAIWDIVEDSNGELWYTKGTNFNSPNSVVKLNKDRTKEINITELFKLDDRQKLFAPLIYKDPNNKLWFNTFGGYSLEYNPLDRSIKHHDFGENNPLYSSVIDKNGRMWITSVGGGLINYNIQTEEKVFYKPEFGNDNSISSFRNITLLIDRTGMFWLGSADKGIDRFDPFKEPFELYTIKQDDDTEQSNNIITSFDNSNLNPNLIWVGTDKGLYVFNKESKEINRFEEIYKTKLPKELLVRKVIEDRNNNLWIGSVSEGLYKVDLKSNKINLLKSDPDDKTTLTSPNVRDMIEDREGNIWIATQIGLNKYDQKSNKVERFKVLDTSYVSGIFELISNLRDNNKTLSSIRMVPIEKDTSVLFSISENKELFVVSNGEVFQNQDGALWDYGWIEDLEGNVIWKMDSLNNRHAGGAVKNRISADVLSLEAGQYYLRYKSDDSHSYGSWNASPPIDPKSWGIELFIIDNSELDYLNENLSKVEVGNSIIDPNIRSVYEDKSGNIWIGSNNSGFSNYSPKTKMFKQFTTTINSVTGFSSSRVNSFLEVDSSIWIATFGGLLELNKETETLESYTVNNGLPTNYINNLLLDNNNNIWFSSQKGLTQFKPRENKESVSFVNFDLKDGIQGYQFSTKGYLKLTDGKLMFGGINGFNLFYPGNINTIPPEVIITKLLLSNEEITPESNNSPLEKSISRTETLFLSHDRSDISFEFTALHYARPDKNQFAHFLEGFDENWIYDNRSFATYTNLDPGEYIFKVKASNSDGVWNEEGSSIKIVISSPWWATIWAYISYVLLTGFIVFTFDRGQKRKIILKEREKQKIQSAELRAKAAEAEARAIQIENERKTKELEEARTLQLSMLPKSLPQLPNLDIAVYMKTATEVGGDYYDFHVALDGTLTAVIGDATGHGLNAGTVVTVTKSLFNSHGSSPDILFTFDEISRCLKEMKFKYLSMCLLLLKIKGDKMQMSAAGMPPALIYRNESKTVEEFLMRGMPLGAPATLAYELKETTLDTGDTILLMSDGFPELLNEEKKMLGYDMARKKFASVAEKHPEEIISYLKDEGSEYVNGADPNDDVTFVVIKVK